MQLRRSPKIERELIACECPWRVFAILVARSGSFIPIRKFKEMAENNHQRLLPLRAPRGIMFDRHDRVLVENRNAFNISILREHSKDLNQTIRLLAEIAKVPEAEIREVVERHKREPAYRPIVVINDAPLPQVAAVIARRLELPDVVVQEVPTRQYPSEALGAHLFGYVGEASEEQVSEGAYAMGPCGRRHRKVYKTM